MRPMLVGGFVAVLLSSSGYALDANKACELYKAQLGDCSCAMQFLQKQIGPKHTEVMMNLWASAAGHFGEKGATMLHWTYGTTALRDAVLEFNRVRTDFLDSCEPPGEDFDRLYMEPQ